MSVSSCSIFRKPYTTFYQRLYGSWNNLKNPFSDPTSRLNACLEKITQLALTGRLFQASTLLQCCQNIGVWNPPSICSNRQRALYGRTHKQALQILKDAKKRYLELKGLTTEEIYWEKSFDTEKYKTFSDKFNGPLNDPKNPFSDPRTRAIECFKKIDQYILSEEIEKAEDLLNRCLAKEELLKSMIGVNQNSYNQEACKRIYEQTLQILKEAKDKQEKERYKQAVENLNLKIEVFQQAKRCALQNILATIENTKRKIQNLKNLKNIYEIERINLNIKILQQAERCALQNILATIVDTERDIQNLKNFKNVFEYEIEKINSDEKQQQITYRQKIKDFDEEITNQRQQRLGQLGKLRSEKHYKSFIKWINHE